MEKEKEKVICDQCGDEFGTTQGLAGHKRLKHRGEAPQQERAVAAGKPVSLEMALEGLRLPPVPQEYNGARDIYIQGFNDGVIWGAKTVLVGVRAAQELSAMGIGQAQPLIKMAQEMRQSEGKTAEGVAQAAAQEAAARVAAYFDQKKPDIAQAPNPMAGLGARMMERVMDNLMDRLLPNPKGETLPPTVTQKREEGASV